ncbi:MAG: amino acid adenylation domain-containing protein [Planctomycetota bacterium]
MNGPFVHSPVQRFARETPDAPAFSFQGEETTWAELEVQSSRVASTLLRLGAQRGDRVGIFMRKGLFLGPAIYGALRAGCAFVPLDPTLPAERLAFIVRDCGIGVVLADDAAAKTLEAAAADLDATVVGPSDSLTLPTVTRAELDAAPVEFTPAGGPATDLDLAYIMYTSGSTGVPKGMMHTHRGSLAYARWGAGHVSLTREDRVASHAPLHFDLSIFDFFSTAQAGGCVVLVPEPVTKFPASCTECLASERVTVIFTVPFTLIEFLERGALDKRDLAALRWVLFGGEPFPKKHLARLMDALPHARFTNVYGPAEAPSCTAYDVPALDAGDETALPIGTVSVNSADLIVDDAGEACSVGEPGELCIRSTTLTIGYWNRPDLDERAFFERPGLGREPEVWYRTGDVVQRRADGLLEFLGRRDRMVKTRGHRVELDEVEAALSAHPAVTEAAVVAVAAAGATREIRAVVRLGDPAPTEAALKAWCRSKLPAYAVPVAIESRADLPRTTSGKIDRSAIAKSLPTP